jgi:protein-disulfide isomerase
LQQNLAAARDNEIRATPTIFIGERRLDGAVPTVDLMAAAQEAAR